ncbi:MAG: GAF domain-containing protein [Devosia sp.]
MLPAEYAQFTRALAEEGQQPQAAFKALQALTEGLVGVKLFTIMVRDSVLGVSQRIFSNMPDAYPVSGTKPANQTHWSKLVIDQKQTFIANDIDAVAAVFDDFELIQSLGCESVINVPIIIDGDVIGTINCLHQAGYYTPERVAASDALKLPGAACLLLNRIVNGAH